MRHRKTSVTNEHRAQLYLKAITILSKLIFKNHEFSNIFLYNFLQFIKVKQTNKFIIARLSDQTYNAITKKENLQSIFYIIIPNSSVKLNRNIFNMGKLTICKSDNENEELRKKGNIMSHIIETPEISLDVPVISEKECEWNKIFVSTELYSNITNKSNLNDNEPIHCSFKINNFDQFRLPLATNFKISLINSPHELSTDIIDSILGNYFKTPRIMCQDFVYKIPLNEITLGFHLSSKYINTFSKIKSINFRCVSIESRNKSSESIAIVTKTFTSLHQAASANAILPVIHVNSKNVYDELFPAGLFKYFEKLKLSIKIFIQNQCKNAQLPSNEFYPTFLIRGKRGVGKTIILKAIGKHFGIQIFNVDCTDLLSSIGAQTETKIRIALSKASICQPLIIALENFEVFAVDNEGQEDCRIILWLRNELKRIYNTKQSFPVIVIALANDEFTQPNIRRLFLETIDVQSPLKNEREEIFEWLLMKNYIRDRIHMNPCIQWQNIIQNNPKIWNELQKISDDSQGFLFDDLKYIFENSIKEMKSEQETSLKPMHLNKTMNEIQDDFSDCLGVPKVPTVLWSDIGGLSKLKDEIQSSIELPLNHNNLMGKNFRRSGVILYGPPGTGKTLIAKAVATEFKLNFLSVQGPELLNMYIGQSEQNIREVFSRARNAAPCVIFLDELDSLAPNRGAAGDSGGVMDRIVSQLLAEIDKISQDDSPQGQIFILAATNRPDLIDPALLRPGRFDKLLYVGPCVSAKDKKAVLKAQMKKFKLSEGTTIQSVVNMLNGEMTGADLNWICSNAWINAVRRRILELNKEKKRLSPKEELNVNTDDFQQAFANFIPSVTKSDLEYFEKNCKFLS